MKYGLDMPLRAILEERACVEALDRHIPGVRSVIEGKRDAWGLSLREVSKYAGSLFPRSGLEALETELEEIGRKNNGVSPAELRRSQRYKALRAQELAREQPSASHHQDAVYPGKPWLDVHGNRIQAHAGGFLYEDGTYYWYGENKEYTDGKSEIWTWGIRLYASRDFYNWEDQGLIIPPDVENPNSQLYPEMNVDRPHILRNPVTGQYVCWLKNSGGAACFNVLTADALKGPWRMANAGYNPFGLHIGDFDIAFDEASGRAYLYCEAEHNKVIGFRLNPEFTAAEEIVSRQYVGLNPPFTREGVTVLQHEGKLWMLTSGMTGYVPNQSDSAVSEGFEIPFTPVGDPHVEDDSLSSFNSQIGQVFKVPGKKDLYLAVADRWVPEYPLDRERAMAIRRASASRSDPEHYCPTEADWAVFSSAPSLATANTQIADYVILPIEFVDGKPQIRWRNEWRLEDFT